MKRRIEEGERWNRAHGARAPTLPKFAYKVLLFRLHSCHFLHEELTIIIIIQFIKFIIKLACRIAKANKRQLDTTYNGN